MVSAVFGRMRGASSTTSPRRTTGYLDVVLELGFTGLLMFVGWLLSCARLLHRALAFDYEWASLPLSLLMSLIYNAIESTLRRSSSCAASQVRAKKATVAGQKLSSPTLQLKPGMNSVAW